MQKIILTALLLAAPHAHAIICPCPCVVRSAMMDGLSHLQQQVRRRTSLARFKISRNSAHL